MPLELKLAIGVGIGLLMTLVGLRDGGSAIETAMFLGLIFGVLEGPSGFMDIPE